MDSKQEELLEKSIEGNLELDRDGKIETEVEEKNDPISTEASEEFVITPYVEEVTTRALTYLQAGYAVHLAGPAGAGKTTMAFHIAAQLNKPVTLVHGNEDLDIKTLIGKESGAKRNYLYDNFIHSVVKIEDEVTNKWVENKLTTACRRGDTLIYDEFNRSRSETNNVLLSVLSERILSIPEAQQELGSGYMEVHSDFKAIFTSNPEEYAGTHKTQDALMDRMITIRVDHPDRETEISIISSRSGIDPQDAAYIVDLLREMRVADDTTGRLSLRSGISIARILMQRGSHPRYMDSFFHGVCRDVLSTEVAKVSHAGHSVIDEMIVDVIKKSCPPVGQPGASRKVKVGAA